jgi:hypothetical protein
MDAEHALTVRRLIARLPRSYREALMLSAAGDSPSTRCPRRSACLLGR